MKIIGLTGFAKSGKSTAAAVLKEMGGQEVAFAKHLKDVCSIVFEVPRQDFDEQALKEVRLLYPAYLNSRSIDKIFEYFEVPKRYVPSAILQHGMTTMDTPRKIAQYVGTELLRGVDKDIHVKMAFDLNSRNNSKLLIMSDVRFKNEADYVHQAGGIMLGIARKAAEPQKLSILHDSEKEVPSLIRNADLVINNDVSVEDFKAQIAMTLTNYLR